MPRTQHTAPSSATAPPRPTPLLSSRSPSKATSRAKSGVSLNSSTSPGSHAAGGVSSGQTGASAVAKTEVNGQGAAAGWAGQLRLPLSWSLQTLMLMLHAGEEFQRAQLDCWHLALKRHEQAHQRLLGCEDTAEMASVHADLLRFDTANLTHLSQRFMDTGVHLNTDMARLIAQTMDGSRHHLMRSAFESFQSGIRTGFRPLDEIFSSPILRELATAGSTGHAG